MGCLALASGMAQSTYHRCSSNEVYQNMLRNDEQFAATRDAIEAQTQLFLNNYSANGSEAVITIPVVVHVLYNTSTQNISDARIQAQINQLPAS